MTRLTVLGMDPAFRNFGLALCEVDVATKEIHPLEIALVQTVKTTAKQVRVSSDNLRSARLLHEEVRRWEKRAAIAIAEIPSGAQSAKAAYGFGLAVGVVAGHAIPLFEVTPTEAKLASIGSRTASKPEIIAWAHERWPGLGWIWGKDRTGQRKLKDENEHMADAIAIVHAGVKTAQFDQAVAMMQAFKGDAA